MELTNEIVLNQLVKMVPRRARKKLAGISPTTELFSNGLIDSIVMIELMSFLERQTGARIDASEVSLEDIDTVERIVAFAAASANKSGRRRR